MYRAAREGHQLQSRRVDHSGRQGRKGSRDDARLGSWTIASRDSDNRGLRLRLAPKSSPAPSHLTSRGATREIRSLRSRSRRLSGRHSTCIARRTVGVLAPWNAQEPVGFATQARPPRVGLGRNGCLAKRGFTRRMRLNSVGDTCDRTANDLLRRPNHGCLRMTSSKNSRPCLAIDRL